MNAFATPPPPVLPVVQQHADDAVVLANARAVLVRAPHVRLRHLQRVDERIDGHLDGLRIAGELGARLSHAALERAGAAEAFVAAALALESGDALRLDRLFAAAGAVPEIAQGVVAAFGWAPAGAVQAVVPTLLESGEAVRLRAGIAACEAHRVDPGGMLADAIAQADAALRAQALHAAGAFARADLSRHCMAALADADEGCRLQAAQALLRLGAPDAATRALAPLAQQPGPWRDPALALLFGLASFERAAPMLEALLADPEGLRPAIRGAGIVGDPRSADWLIARMDDPRTARIAGEAFTRMTGADLAALDLECAPPDGSEWGPRDDPADDDVALDEDDGLPWPDPGRVRTWWARHGAGFDAGTRYFLGAPPSPAHCLRVLAEGCQRQRIDAAGLLCLLQPGSVLFPTAAPAWRQQHWLARMGAAVGAPVGGRMGAQVGP